MKENISKIQAKVPTETKAQLLAIAHLESELDDMGAKYTLSGVLENAINHEIQTIADKYENLGKRARFEILTSHYRQTLKEEEENCKRGRRHSHSRGKKVDEQDLIPGGANVKVDTERLIKEIIIQKGR